MTTTITVTKIEAARRQLSTAIELWANDADPVSIHSLAFSSYQIVHDLNRLNKGPHLLLDDPNIRPEMKSEFVNIVKRAANFFKHADGRRNAKTQVPLDLEFDPSVNELFFAITITGLKYLGQNLTTREIAFHAWYGIQRPDMLTDTGSELLKNGIPTQVMDSLRLLNKREFLKRFVEINFGVTHVPHP